MTEVPEEASLPGPNDGPLADIVVLETGTGVAVAFCGKLLADFGATVVKIEHPTRPDPVREISPQVADGDGTSESALSVFLNRNKFRVTLDYATELGELLLHRLVARADILTTFAGAGMFPLPAPVSSPKRVQVELSWFGRSGPWRGFACNDFLAQHVSGMAFATAVRVPDPATQPPLATPGHLAEMVGGLSGATAAVIALLGQELDGTSETVDVAIAEAVTSFMRQEVVTYSYGVGIMSRSDKARSPIAAPVYQQPTADGYVDMMILQEGPWTELVDILGNPEWSKNELFATHPSRAVYWDALEPLLQQELARFSSEEIYAAGQRRGIAIAPINSLAAAAASPQFSGRSFFESAGEAFAGLKFPGPPFQVGELEDRPSGCAFKGSANTKVFGDWLGTTPAELAALAQSGVI